VKAYFVNYTFETEKEYSDFCTNGDDFKLIIWLVDKEISPIAIEDCDDNGKDCASFSFKLKKDAIRFAKAFGLPLEGPYDYDFSNPWLPYDWNGDWDDLPGFRD
jgi:hypothetical protein